MGLILLTIAIIIVIVVLMVNGENTRDDAAAVAITCSVMLALVVSIGLGVSYKNYLRARTFYSAGYEQFTTAIDMYESKANIDMQKAFTDSKYRGYQESMASLIEVLRRKVVKYNKIIIGKQIMASNWFFSWFIIESDPDMVIIKMGELKTEIHGKRLPFVHLPPT